MAIRRLGAAEEPEYGTSPEYGTGPADRQARLDARKVAERREQLARDIRFLLLAGSGRTPERVERELTDLRRRYRGGMPRRTT